MDDQSNAKPGLTDAELAVHPTVYATDAAGAAGDDHDLVLQRISRVNRRMHRKLCVGQAGFGVRLIIHVSCRPCHIRL